MEEKGISRGVRYQIARLLSLEEIRSKDITSDILEELRGCNKDAAPRVTQAFSKTSPNANDNSVFDQAFAQEKAANVRFWPSPLFVELNMQ